MTVFHRLTPRRIARVSATVVIGAACLALFGACATTSTASEEKTGKEQSPATRVMVAEIALERGECREAAENYLTVANGSDDPKLARRATEVALACGQLQSSAAAVKRWRVLAPRDAEAALAAAIIALKLYRLDDARAALTQWRDSGAQGAQDPSEFALLLERESDSTAALAVFSDVLAGSDPTAEVLLAQGQLALHSFDLKRAIECGRRAQELDAGNPAARALVVRAQALLGQADAALSGARDIERDFATNLEADDRFLVADVLIAFERTEEARAELMNLRKDATLQAAADRRLGAMAMEMGDDSVAERHFSQLVGEQGSTAIAVYYLGRLAERRQDTGRALENYKLIADTPLATVARSRAASILLKRGSRVEALALFDDYARQHPEEGVELASARAQVLADHGDFDAAHADIEAALRRYPGHPSLEYQRAALLERAGRTREAEAALDRLVRERPADPGLANALGFTLADHNRELPRAEKLVQRALDTSPDSPAIQDSLGWIRFRQGRTQEAARMLEHAFKTGRDAEIAAHWGEALWVLGDKSGARSAWARALTVDPDNALVKTTVARLTGEK
ncbi:MAG: tetratricopeptide repeat protein [Steroidobacteraceae bacterium]